MEAINFDQDVGVEMDAEEVHDLSVAASQEVMSTNMAGVRDAVARKAMIGLTLKISGTIPGNLLFFVCFVPCFFLV